MQQGLGKEEGEEATRGVEMVGSGTHFSTDPPGHSNDMPYSLAGEGMRKLFLSSVLHPVLFPPCSIGL